ncbi:MAG TPA: cation diffusion facilitator family transporter [Spirochaetota bacterium]|nr:cation diffusion facilitator family transporter [Spirochaetota bacterium]
MTVTKSAPLKFIWVSIAASVITISLKSTAYLLTGSVGLLSDAIESFINLAAAIMALVMLLIASSPPDREHPFGHHKAEYFSSVTEGIMILLAAIAIGVTAIERLLRPQPVEQLGIGLLISTGASLINLSVAVMLLRAGKKYRSITLEADGRHLMTDVWTTGGVLVALLLVKVTGWIILDPVIAILVAANIVFTGIKLIIRSVSGLMDSALSEDEQNSISKVLDSCCTDVMKYHSLYTRRAASRNFIFVHLLMPGNWDISNGHKITKEIEQKIKDVLNNSDVFIHIEPLDDPDAFDDYLEQKST